ncbi:MAG: cytochrome c biogenesis protein CcsA [Fimbriimonadaceae bacterium]|nr:cytochrome c biogenesis protein CcsA [Fimbriimonadaceae bacterium]
MTTVCYIAESAALLAYLAAAVLYPQRLLRPDSRSTRYAHWGLLLGAGLQGLGLLAHTARKGSEVVFGQWANITFVLVLLIVIGLLVLERRTERPALGAFLAPVVFLLVLLTVFEPRVTVRMVENPWFVWHIALTLLAYACFGIAFCAAAAYLRGDWLLKRKRVAELASLPPLHTAERVAHRAAAFGLCFFTLGLGVGLAFLFSLHQPADLKVYLSVMIWGVYASYLFVRDVPRWRGTRLHLFLVVGFVLVLANLQLARHRLPFETAPPPGVANP